MGAMQLDCKNLFFLFSIGHLENEALTDIFFEFSLVKVINGGVVVSNFSKP